MLVVVDESVFPPVDSSGCSRDSGIIHAYCVVDVSARHV